MIEQFNSLAAAFVSCEIGEAEFRRCCAQQSFGYDNAEMRIIMNRLRQQRSAATHRILQGDGGC